jgi:hypothetical protein
VADTQAPLSRRTRRYADEMLVCESEPIGKAREQLRSFHFRRDRGWLRP